MSNAFVEKWRISQFFLVEKSPVGSVWRWLFMNKKKIVFSFFVHTCPLIWFVVMVLGLEFRKRVSSEKPPFCFFFFFFLYFLRCLPLGEEKSIYSLSFFFFWESRWEEYPRMGRVASILWSFLSTHFLQLSWAVSRAPEKDIWHPARMVVLPRSPSSN